MESSRWVKITLLLASSLTVMSGALIAPALPIIADHFSDVENAEFLTRLVLTAPALAIAIFSPIAGGLIDRFGKIKLFILGMVLYAAAGGAGFIISNIYVLLASRALLGVAVGFIMTTATTLIGDYFEGEERNSFLGTQAAFMALGGTVFVALAGLLADISWRYPFLLYLFSLLVIGLVLRFLKEPQPSNEDTQYSSNGVPKNYPKGPIILAYAATFAGMALFYVIPVQSPFLLEQIGVEKESLLGLGLILATVFAALASRLHPIIKKLTSFAAIYVLTFGLMALGYGLIALTSTLWMVLLGTVIAGFGAGLLMPNGNLWLIQVTNPAKRGKVIGGMTTAVFLGQFFSPVLLQPVISSYSIFIAHAVAAAFALLMVGVYIVATFRQSPAKSRQKVPS